MLKFLNLFRNITSQKDRDITPNDSPRSNKNGYTINIHNFGEINFSLPNRESYKEFTSAQEAEDWGRDYYSDWAARYKRIMKDASKILRDHTMRTQPLEFYCGHSHRMINDCLRNDASTHNNHAYAACCLLLASICDAPRIPENIIVYRLVPDEFISELLENYKAGASTIEKGFMSTSLLQNYIVFAGVPYSRHQHLLKIYVKKGSPGVYVNSVTRRPEQEVLFAPNRHLGMIAPPQFDAETGKNVYECLMMNYD